MDKYFVGELNTRMTYDCSDDWFPAHIELEFLSDFAFVDSTGLRWEAKLGDVIEFVNLLQVIWRKAKRDCKAMLDHLNVDFDKHSVRTAIIYDVACQKRLHTSIAANRMVYESMLTEGASPSDAVLYFNAVNLHGPLWPDEKHLFSNLLYQCRLKNYQLLT